jgi:4,5-DOPA dioxygenase extradiol
MRAPALFLGHGARALGAPDIEDSSYARALARFGARAPTPEALLVVSDRWRTRAAAPVLTAGKHPETIHDFTGSIPVVDGMSYPCPGWPQLAHRVAEKVGGSVDRERGLDHGVWMPLRLLFPLLGPAGPVGPSPKVRVVQMSVPHGGPDALLALGRAVAAFRDEGIWIVGCGGTVRPRGRIPAKDAPTPAWARAFDDWIAARVAALDLARLLDYEKEAPNSSTAAPTGEGLAPLFVVLGAARPGDRVTAIHQGFDHAVISLRCFALSPP